MKYSLPVVLVALLLVLAPTSPAQAGEPIGEIGVMNPTMFKCVLKDNRSVELIQEDPWRKELTPRYTFVRGGQEFNLERLDEILREYPNAQEETCINELNVDYGFNPYDAQEFNAYLEKLENQCEEEDDNAIIVPITDTKIEGFVYEFHPEDRENPAESDWFAVPSKSVMVRARGITFEIFWGSGEEGGYYFDNLGAGPIILDLQLPKDAHPINPDVVIFSNGLEETWTVFLGFYRGDVPPPNPSRLRTPSGSFLPFLTLADIENLSRCGSTDLPDVVERALPPPDTLGFSQAAMPEVGAVRPTKPASQALGLTAAMVLSVLAYAGIRRTTRPE